MSFAPLPPNRRSIVLGLAAGLATSLWSGGAAASAQHSHLLSGAAFRGSSRLAPLNALRTHQPLLPLPKLTNRSNRAGHFRARMVAAPAQHYLMQGLKTPLWCYNGISPGPLMEAFEGDRIDIDFFNQLEQPSTIHWHGLAIPADQDGAPQDFVPAKGQRRYQFTLPPGSAGTHWYHPHPHMLTAEQVYRGLAGAFIVRDRADPLAHIPEQHLFISDLKLGDEGAILPNDREDWMNGREGQFVLINGAYLPRITLAGTQRWRIWNACNARYLRLSLDGLPFTLVGTDGGLLGAPVHGLTDILLTPAQRVEIVVTPPPDRLRTWLVAEPYDRGAMGRLAGPSPRRVLADIDLLDAGPMHSVPPQLRPIAPLGEPTAQHVAAFSDFVDLQAPVPDKPYARPTDMVFMVNGQHYDIERIDVEGRLGAVEQWTLVNASSMGMDHPFHIHGGHFQVLERTFDGVSTPEPFLAWRDMLNLRAGESATIRMRIDEPGLRMFHCHILEHEDLGMMGNLRVA